MLSNLHPSTSNRHHSLTSFTSCPDHVCFTGLCPSNQQFIHNVSPDIEPSSYEEEILNLAWQVTVTREFDALYANYNWELVSLPKGENVVGVYWCTRLNTRKMVV